MRPQLTARTINYSRELDAIWSKHFLVSAFLPQSRVDLDQGESLLREPIARSISTYRTRILPGGAILAFALSVPVALCVATRGSAAVTHTD